LILTQYKDIVLAKSLKTSFIICQFFLVVNSNFKKNFYFLDAFKLQKIKLKTLGVKYQFLLQFMLNFNKFAN